VFSKFKCPFCEEFFRANDDLMAHMFDGHNITSPNLTVSITNLFN
jgi:uncharacterized C2H2 Zn-finger protein